ncbi:MAG TPA: hypothetical protein VFV27_04325 [Nevskiaceae bacterium]|nr:hypothetical protein [Nevskiaceae bacterium]
MRAVARLALLALAPAVHGAEADLRACRAVAAADARLACYDRLADAQAGPAADAVAAPAAPVASAPAPAPPAAVAAAAAAPALSPAAVEAGFGAEQLPRDRRDPAEREAENLTVTTRLVGTFEGWEKGQLLRLANGQVWKVMDDYSRYYPAREAPAVVLKRGILGSYWLELPELEARVKVRRVQ